MAPFTIPDRPPTLSISKTCFYKSVGNISIPLDIYLPAAENGTSHPIMLFIHGGGWTGGSRSDYCRPLFNNFLSHGFVVTSMDYRLLPETSLPGQLEDVRDVELWLRNRLQSEVSDPELKVDRSKIIVVGASAGALLALFTPKLWAQPPTAILSMYGPTDMHTLPYLGMGRISKLPLPLSTPETLAAAFDFEKPPTEISIPKNSDDYMRPRGLMGMNIFRRALIAEFMIRGLERDENGGLKLPEKGSASKEEIDEISPLHLASTIIYPPTCQVMGDNDEIFQISHVHKFHAALEEKGVKCKKVVVPGMGHAFDNWESIGGEMDREVIGPAVDWVVRFAKESGEKKVVEEKEVPKEKDGRKWKRNWFGWLKWPRRK